MGFQVNGSMEILRLLPVLPLQQLALVRAQHQRQPLRVRVRVLQQLLVRQLVQPYKYDCKTIDI